MAQNEDWQVRKDNAIARGMSNLSSIFVDRALGSELWDLEGRRYIDFGAGIAVVNTGHRHPKVLAAVASQIERFTHTCLMVTPYDSAVRLAEKLNERAPGATAKKTIFLSSGAEAVENAVKIARAHTGRRGVIAFNGGFHGRTNLTLGLTGKVAPYKSLFGPFPAEIYHAPYPIDYYGISVEDALCALDTLFHVELAAEEVAAIVIEPVLGEGGFHAAPVEFLQALRRLCDEHGIVMVADEVQTGFARTGRFFCSEYAKIEPDLVTLAKGIAGGFPLSAVTGKAEIMDAPLPGGLGSTYGGSPIGCAAALAVLDVIEEEGLVERSTRVGSMFASRLSALQEAHPDTIGQVRNLGAMIAMELVKDGDPDRPNPELTKAIVAEASRRGVILLACGVRGNVIRFLPALTIEESLVEEGMNLVSDALKAQL